MTFRKSILLLIGLSTIAALVACGGSSSHPATITLSSVPASLTVNSQTPITATVSNSSATVDWSVTCSTSSCGAFSSTTGTQVTYIAPPSPTTGVVITATLSGTSPAVTGVADTAIVAATLADGTYVFSLAGEDANGNYYVAGEITIAGGLITAGEQDFNDTAHDRNDGINPTGSSISSTTDGNLTITLVTCTTACSSNSAPDTIVGVGGTETLNGTILPLSTTGRAFITEFDGSASASGELDPQDLANAGSTTPAKGYAFVLNGYDSGGTADPEAVGGIINIDGAGTISGAGSILDVNDAGATFPSQHFTASTVSAPDPLGRVIFTLNTTIFSQVLLAGYIVDSNRIQLVEIHDAYSGDLGGVAYSQSNGTVTTGGFTTANAAGTYVVGVTGFDNTPGVLQAVSQLTLTAGAGVTGFIDYNDLANSSGLSATSPDPVTAVGYIVDAAGAGDITIAGVTDAGPTVDINVQLYLDGNGHALAITMDATDVVAGAGFAQGTGVTSTSFNGSYGLDVTGDDDNVENELDGVGPVSVTSGAIAGTVDLNWLGSPSPGPTYLATAVNGTFVTTGGSAPNGIFTGTITGVDVVACITNSSCSNDNFSYYLIDSAGDNIAIETDESQLTLGFFLQQ